MKKAKLKKINTVVLFSLFIILMWHYYTILADNDYLIVRIVDADYPPEIYIHEELNFTLFAFTVYYQIENPTQSTIYVDYICSPIPFPWLEANLIDDNITANLGFGVEWVGGSYECTPGIYEGSYAFTIEIVPYKSNKLPLGEYILWFNFTDCCSVNVPVIVKKMQIYSLEDKMVYIYYSDNSTEVFDYPTTISTIETERTSFSVAMLITYLLIFKKRKFKQIKKMD